jgi:hypothetical protein
MLIIAMVFAVLVAVFMGCCYIAGKIVGYAIAFVVLLYRAVRGRR